MDSARIIAVLEICVPVFTMIGLGKILALSGRLKDEHCSFINWLVYSFSLPALIFNGVARQRFDTFLDPAVILMPVCALAIVAALTMGIAKLNGYKGGFAAAFVFGTFWANASYIGLPLSQNAFGAEGFAKAAIYNGLVIPVFILCSYLLIGLYGAGSRNVKIGQRIRHAFMNPVMLSALAGIVAAVLLEPYRNEAGALTLPATILTTGELFGSFLKMIGTMGLPLALLSIGASLKWEQTRSHLGALGWTVGCKLILLPLTTLLLIRFFCPTASPVSIGVPVLLATTPCAVASYVVSCQLGVERGFVSSMLVLSTVLSVFTIPVWIYLLKGLPV
jgi:predicted permease